MNCTHVRRLLPRYVDGDLPGSERDLVAQHLQACAACRERAALHRRLPAALAAMPLPEGAAAAEERIRLAVLARASRPQPRWRRLVIAGSNVVAWLTVTAVTCALLLAVALTWRPGFPHSRQAAAPAAAPLPPAVIPTTTPAAKAAPSSRVNILILGADEREPGGSPCRTDTVLVCGIDPINRTLALLSIPRDLYVAIPTGGEVEEHDRINTVYAYGDGGRYPGGGPALAKRTVEHNLGIPIHYYVRVDFQGFERFIDEIGGIEVDVPREIIDTAYPTADYGVTALHIPAGRQHMDGDLALKYARTRHSTSDLDRTRRQQQIILAVRERALSGAIPPSRLPGLLQILGSSISTDMPLEEINRLAQTASQVEEPDIRRAVIDESMIQPWTTPEGASVLLPQEEKVRALVTQLFPKG